MCRIRTVMLAIVAGLTGFKGYHRVIHGCIGEGATRILVTTITIDFLSIVLDRNVKLGWCIQVIADTLRTCTPFVMATGIRTTTRHTRMIEGRGRFKGGSGMACCAVRARHHMVRLGTFT